MSVAELKRRVKELNVDIPPEIVEKSELVAFVARVEAQRSQGGCTESALGGTSEGTLPTPSQRQAPTVAALKARLRELNVEIPTTIVEKRELQELVLEVERQRARVPPPQSPAPEAAPGDLPEPWYAQESRSKPGRFYFVNGQTGETTWTRPARAAAEAEVPPASPAQGGASSAGNSADVDGGAPKNEILIDDAKHDYRDKAFRDAQEKPEAVSRERAWSRANSMSSVKGPLRRVQSLRVEPVAEAPAAEAPPAAARKTPKAEQVIVGSCLTWVKGEMIGRGSLGRVFKATDTATGQVLAVKEVPLGVSDDGDQEFLRALENEISIMEGLRHPNVLDYLGHDYLDGSLFIYLEHMPGGTLTQALQQFGPFEESLIAQYSKQILDGLEYMHTRSPSVVHRDLKGSNILVGFDGRAKLADFGCSKQAERTLTHTMRGSVPWMAPEVIAHSRHGLASDIWSFGCVAIEMGTAKIPWGHFDNQMAALVKIGMSQDTPPLPEGISELCEDFIRQCVARDPERRPSATELLNHELVRDILPPLG